MSWASELAPELLCRPTGLIGLTGLDITYNAIHKLIWDSFYNNRRSDRVPLQFRVFAGDHEYPKCRTNKRQSYEWYIPKGILKTAWMNKHLNQVPAVVVVFFDLDWDEPLWKEKQMECATRVEIVRNSLQGRGTKVAVVLIQKNAPLPPGEDVVAAERAASLCSSCDLSAKQLYVLPHTDHLIGYTIRLENAFYELAQSYYHGEARKVKSHRDFLNKTTHQLLFVRHQFKIAFFNELKQDSHTSLKHYKQAYGHLLDLRMHDTNLLEIKTNAGFINYKICRLCFQHNAPLDAIAQFRKHIDFFKLKVGVGELAFEHSAWMSRQFQVFGDLFDEAIKLGLTAIQTQHPGFYYQQAANHAINRKQLCRGLCKPLTQVLQPDPLENLTRLDFYGQRPWRQGHQSIEPPDLQKEKEGILALQSLEVNVDHSWQIIPLLSSAVAQFKKYKSPRMKRYLMVQMGEEYFHAKDYDKALMLLNKVTWDYRGERWWTLLTSILEISLKCAYLTAKVQDYVSVCLELVGKYGKLSDEEKTRIQMNLTRVMMNDTPEAEPGLDTSAVENARRNWQISSETPCIFNMDMQNIVSFVECKATFSSETSPADSEVNIQVFIRANCQFPIRFCKLSVHLNNQIYNDYCKVVDGHGISAVSDGDLTDKDLYLVPGKTKFFTFSFLPVKDDINSQLEISSVILDLGSESGRCALLRWSGGGGDSVMQPLTAQSLLTRKPIKSSTAINWDQISVISKTKILPRTAKVDLNLLHDAPCLLNEVYQLTLEIDNKEDVDISNVRLSFGVKEDSSAVTDQTSKNIKKGQVHVCVDKAEFDGKNIHVINDIDIGQIKQGGKGSRTIYIKNLQVGTRNVFFKVEYDVSLETKQGVLTCSCQREEEVALTTVNPFEVSVKLQSMKFEELDTVQIQEPFLLVTELNCTSPWTIEMSSSHLNMCPLVSYVDQDVHSQLQGGVFRKLTTLSKKKGCESIAPWAHSISNHMYWTAASSNGDGQLALEKWSSVANHVVDVHRGHGTKFQQCEHEDLAGRQWILNGSKAHKELKDVVLNGRLLKDVQKLSPAEQTSQLESFHKLICQFAPKFQHFFYDAMRARVLLAVLHNNENAGRLQASKRDGTLKFKVSYPKGKQGEHVVKRVKEDCTYVNLNKSECASEIICLRTQNADQTPVTLGTYTVTWRRKTDEDIPYVNTIFPLPTVNTEYIPLSVELRLPAYGGVKALLPLHYILHNRTPYPQEMEVNMETNDCFMFSGNKQFHFRVLPGSPYHLNYNLFPLVAGHVMLPKLNFTLLRYPDPVDAILQKMLPTHIFIKPCGKVLSQGT